MSKTNYTQRIALASTELFFSSASILARQSINLVHLFKLSREAIPIIRETHKYKLAAYDIQLELRDKYIIEALQSDLDIALQDYLALVGEHHPEYFLQPTQLVKIPAANKIFPKQQQVEEKKEALLDAAT